MHQALLQRPRPHQARTRLRAALPGLDFRHGGFVDRALEAFQEVVRLDPQNRYALVNLQKLHEEQHQWADAHDVREQIAKIDGGDRAERPADPGVPRATRSAASQALRGGDDAEAARRFQRRIDIDARTAPAYLNLGDVRERRATWPRPSTRGRRLIEVVPDRAYLAFDRLERAYSSSARRSASSISASRSSRGIRRTGARGSRSRAIWRAADITGEALDLLLDALPHNPHGLVVHQAIWQALSALGLDAGARPTATSTLTRDAVFYLDPHVCMRCRYRSTELLWQCPQCHEWNTFVEERIAPRRTRPSPRRSRVNDRAPAGRVRAWR